jgi:hypothetical protein
MPNHIHGIIIINNPVGNGPARSSKKYQKIDNLSTVIGSYKSTVSKQINQLNNIKLKWQKSFHDHVIRTGRSLRNIREYIANNILNWGAEENNIKIIEGEAGLAPTGQLVQNEPMLTKKMKNIKTALLSALLCLIGILPVSLSANAQEITRSEKITTLACDLKISLSDTYMWRDWAPGDTSPRQGKDGGSPLMVISSFNFDNSKGNLKKIHWEAWLSSKNTKEIFPVEIWDSDSISPWNGDLQAGQTKDIKLRTYSGPYLEPGDNVVLSVRFFINGKEVLIKSAPTEIKKTE